VSRVLASSLSVESDRLVDIGSSCVACHAHGTTQRVLCHEHHAGKRQGARRQKSLPVRGAQRIMVLGGLEGTLLRQTALPLGRSYGG
jgi:hypothetical protein